MAPREEEEGHTHLSRKHTLHVEPLSSLTGPSEEDSVT